MSNKFIDKTLSPKLDKKTDRLFKFMETWWMHIFVVVIMAIIIFGIAVNIVYDLETTHDISELGAPPTNMLPTFLLVCIAAIPICIILKLKR